MGWTTLFLNHTPIWNEVKLSDEPAFQNSQSVKVRCGMPDVTWASSTEILERAKVVSRLLMRANELILT